MENGGLRKDVSIHVAENITHIYSTDLTFSGGRKNGKDIKENNNRA